jgi:diacylglycerol kinase family enzyme
VVAIVAAFGTLVVNHSVFDITLVVVLSIACAALARAAVRSEVMAQHAEHRRSSRPIAPAGTHPVLILNPKSGGGKANPAFAAEARARGIETVTLQPGDDLERLARDAIAGGADVIGMAGGDGSQALVAGIAAEHDVPFVCIPAGTRNHFALDVGVDRGDLVGSLDAFTDGVERRIDVAEVNGRLFLNNVSLGIYGDAVRESAYRDAKARTLARTAVTVLGPSAPAAGLELADDRGRSHRDPAVVLVSNNPYSFDPPRAPGTRPALDSGQLGVVVLDRPASGRTSARTWAVKHIEVIATTPVHAGIDGEAIDLSPPLRFVVRPAALRMRISRSQESARRP